MGGQLRRTCAAAVLVSSALLAGACDNGSDDVGVDDLRGAFGGGTVDAAVDLFAGSGIEVRVRPQDEPMERVEGGSPVRLLRFQVRNLALEANQGGGLLGAELDAFIAEAGGEPISSLIAGWSLTAPSPAARTAAALLGDVDGTDPRRLTIPGFVVTLFLADLVGAQSASTSAGTSSGSMLGSWVHDTDDDFCGAVTSYLSAALADINDPDVELEPSWLADAIDRAAAFEPDPRRLRNSVAAMSLYVYATSVARPWVPLLVVNPLGGFHHQVGENEIPPTTEVRLSVDTGEGFIAEEARGCAALAGLQLPERDVEGTDVLWLTEGLVPHAKVDDEGPGGDLELDENGSAIWEFEPITETSEAHRNGTQHTATIPVAAVIRREEIADVRTQVRSLLTGGDLGAAAPDVIAMYDRLDPMIEQLLYPRASAYATVTWHTPKPPDDENEDPQRPDAGDGLEGGPCGDGCAASNGDPHLVPLSGPPYDFQAAGEFVLLRSPDGDVEIQARQTPVGDETDLTLNAAIAARVGDRRVGIYADDEGVRVLLDGAPVDLADAVDLGGGGRLTSYERGVEVVFPDGTIMWALPRLGAVEIIVSPSDGLRSDAVGLLGPSTAEGYALPALPDGSAVPEPANRREAFELLYGEYEDAWRVTAESSLFEYEPGESPESFLVEDYPVRPLDYEDLTPEQIAAGSAACDAVDLLPAMREACILDVVVTGDVAYAEMYALTADVVADAADGLGEPGPLINALPTVEEPSVETGEATVTESEPSAAETLTPAPSVSGAPTLTLRGTVAAVGSDAALGDDVVTELEGAFTAAAGTVVVARVETCPPEGLVYMDVFAVDLGTSAFSFPCDPNQLAGALLGEDDELPAGETYLWLTGAGDYQVSFSVETEAAVPLAVEVFADPTPTIVEQEAILDGDATQLAGIADTVVYAFDGTAATALSFTATGMTEACALDAYGAPEVGDGGIWALHICGHTTTPAGGLSNAGFAVPVIVFARTDGPIDVVLTPAS